MLADIKHDAVSSIGGINASRHFTSSVDTPSQRKQESHKPEWLAWSNSNYGTFYLPLPEHSSHSVPNNRISSTKSQKHGILTCCAGETPLLLLYFSVFLNSGIFIAAVFVYVKTNSQLVLAQAADSFLDVGSNVVIAYAARVARCPPDHDHLYGHQRSEPIGALIVAVITVVVAIQVFGSAIESLVTKSYPEPDIAIAVILGAKGGLKLLLILAILFATSFRPSENIALYALFIDTGNDVAACITSLGGFGLTLYGKYWGDGLFAILLSFYVAYNGFDLGRGNLKYIMGGAPEKSIFDELVAIAGGVDGVSAVSRIRAQYIGQTLQAGVIIVVPSNTSAGEAHNISVDVQRALEADERVAYAFVHVDTDATASINH